MYIFIIFERACMSEGRDRGTGRGKESQADSMVSTELDTALNPMTLTSRSEMKPKVRYLTD